MTTVTTPQPMNVSKFDFRECPRCGEVVYFTDMKDDRRWGETCDSCYEQLMSEHGQDPQNKEKPYVLDRKLYRMERGKVGEPIDIKLTCKHCDADGGHYEWCPTLWHN